MKSSTSRVVKSTSEYLSISLFEIQSAHVYCQTSIMAVQFKDGVIIGADSRTTTGSYIVRLRLFKLRLSFDNMDG